MLLILGNDKIIKQAIKQWCRQFYLMKGLLIHLKAKLTFNKIYCMKKILVIICLVVSINSVAQKTKSTYILIRHAEKDTTEQGSTTMNANPPLNALGVKRAERLVQFLKEYSIDTIYSTNYIRTIETVKPLSKKTGKEIQIYNPKDLKQFAQQLLKQNGKTIVVVGHSNTTPALVNLLIDQEEYKALDEKVYNKIFIVTIVKASGRTEVEVLRY